MAGRETLHRALRVPWFAVAGAGALAFALWHVATALDGPYLERVGGGTTYTDSPALLALFVPYGLALLAWRRGARPSLRAILGAGLVAHVALALVPPPGSQDLFQYLFYGKMAAVLGANPYVVEPARFAADPWFPHITWTTQTSLYGPAWILPTAGVAKAAGASLLAAFAGMKALVLVLDLAVMALIAAVARSEGEGAGFGLLAWALNPLVLVAVPVEGHADVAIAAAFLGAVLARRRGRPGVATALLALAGLVKGYALVALALHLALLWRERGPRRAAAHAGGALALAAALYGPYLRGLDTFGGAGELAGRFGTSLAGTLYRLLTLRGPGVAADPGPVGALVLGAGAAFVVVVLAVLSLRVRDEAGMWTAVTLGYAAYLLATPWTFPWHLLPLVALAAARPRDPTAPAVLVAGASLLVAFRLSAYHPGLALQAALRYAPPLAVYGWSRRRAPRPLPAPAAR